MTTRARTVLFHTTGGPEVLAFEDLPLGPLSPGSVRVRIDAIGLNRAEALFRAGTYYYDPELPASRIGFEAAGRVEEVGPEVTGFAPGDPVVALVRGHMSRGGVHADLADVNAGELLHRPRDVDAVTGAAVWTAYLTAYGALAEVGGLAPGDHTVITAASSSVGLAAIRTARRLGAHPIALTRTGAKAGRLRAAGAAEVVATDGGGATDRVLELTGGRGAAVVLDAVAGPGLAETARAVAPGGTLVVYGWLDGRPAPLPMNWPLNIHGFALDHVTDHPDRFRRARAFVESGLASGALVADVDRVFDFADMAKAHHHLESNTQAGKVVVTVAH